MLRSCSDRCLCCLHWGLAGCCSLPRRMAEGGRRQGSRKYFGCTAHGSSGNTSRSGLHSRDSSLSRSTKMRLPICWLVAYYLLQPSGSRQADYGTEIGRMYLVKACFLACSYFIHTFSKWKNMAVGAQNSGNGKAILGIPGAKRKC